MSLQPAAEMAVDLYRNWFDPIETEVRARARQSSKTDRGELDAALARRVTAKPDGCNEAMAEVTGHRHGSRKGRYGTFGPIETRCRALG